MVVLPLNTDLRSVFFFSIWIFGAIGKLILDQCLQQTTSNVHNTSHCGKTAQSKGLGGGGMTDWKNDTQSDKRTYGQSISR